MSRPQKQLIRVVAPALWALRAHWVTATLLTLTGAVALAALLPVSALFGGSPLALGSRLLAPALPNPDLQLPLGADATTPAAYRAAATGSLFSVLALIAAGVFLVAAITLLAISDARSAARAQEVSVRRAVGASRILLHLAAAFESAVVAAAILLAGGVVGLLVTHATSAAWSGELAAGTLWVTVGLTASLLGLIGFGVSLPATRERRRMPLGGRKGRALELVLPALQLGVSLTVLGAAALLARHARGLEGTAGTAAGSGVVFQMGVPDGPAAMRARAYDRLLQRLHTTSGVLAASLTSADAELGLGTGDGILTDCGHCAWGGIAVPWKLPFVTHYLVSADTFRTLDLKVLKGRGITSHDAFNAPRVAVVSASLARDNFEGGHAVGRRLQIGHGLSDWYTVVGVVADQLPAGFGGGLQPSYALYLSVLQHPARTVDLVVRGAADSSSIASVQGALDATLGGGVTVRKTSEASYLAREAGPVRWFGRMFGALGWVMLTLASLGTCVVMWLWVSSITHDLAVRRAVGARRRDIFRFILSRAAGVAVSGIVFGLWCGIIVWGALTSVVAGLPPWEPSVLIRFSVLLSLAAVVGALLPAWRIAHASPATLVGQGDS